MAGSAFNWIGVGFSEWFLWNGNERLDSVKGKFHDRPSDCHSRGYCSVGLMTLCLRKERCMSGRGTLITN
jgi:hypothetical protein